MRQQAVRVGLVAIALALVLGCAGTAFAEERIQLAILLDTSNSMDGLIGQAKAQLWKVVNELARARRGGRHPQLEVALFEYGNDGLREADGYLRMVSDLTTDLDRISEKLFGLTTDGGDEYCGAVIGRAVDRLSWSGSDDVLKVIYIAGNEPFDQGGVSYKASATRAARKGIVVNTIFCGSYDEGVVTFWKDGAIRAEGRYMSIDQDEVVEDIVTPFDADIVRLGEELNGTYVAYGREGEASKIRQAEQDANAAGMGTESSVQRSVAKAQEAYVNERWDLADAVQSGTVKVASLKDDELPVEMRKMSPAERQEYVDGLVARRADVQRQINDLNEQRRVYVEAETKGRAQNSTLGQAILLAVKEQAERKGFVLE
ncbi:MAG: VWA domain-containing protein [Spirochaetes bacterium]|nr:VWA domain-containing protein [Spirochaetota bacterium]